MIYNKTLSIKECLKKNTIETKKCDDLIYFHVFNNGKWFTEEKFNIVISELREKIKIFLMKNILIISQYFWPDNFLINDFSQILKKNEYNVSIVTGSSGYYVNNTELKHQEKNYLITIIKLFNYLLFQG